ncbi:unnamed protein product [Enterobius vermicularis]|uniref:Uncharacterized protein n=1 Tax=Enterobius vermicularis TaxID=51028 RepID=A0A0N4VP39_ENTVE|nr:unnamed protein product [Enterobius vermicularis]
MILNIVTILRLRVSMVGWIHIFWLAERVNHL